jgi:hypothetical protein
MSIKKVIKSITLNRIEWNDGKEYILFGPIKEKMKKSRWFDHVQRRVHNTLVRNNELKKKWISKLRE